jgi:hypothetical protein
MPGDPHASYVEHNESCIEAMIHGGGFLTENDIGTKT